MWAYAQHLVLKYTTQQNNDYYFFLYSIIDCSIILKYNYMLCYNSDI